MQVRSIETGVQYNLCLPDPHTGQDTLLALVNNLDIFHVGHPQFFMVEGADYYEANQETIDWWVSYLKVRTEAETAEMAFNVRLDELPHNIAEYWHSRFLHSYYRYYTDEIEEQSRYLLMVIRMITFEMDQSDDLPPSIVSRGDVIRRVRRKLAQSNSRFVKAPGTSRWQIRDYFVVSAGLITARIQDLGSYARSIGVLLEHEVLQEWG